MADTIHLLMTGHYKRIRCVSYSPTIQRRVKPDLVPVGLITVMYDPGNSLEKLEAVVKAIEIEFQIPDHDQIND